ncbi:hypothetical protein CK203_041263 [Vitis vinifera]|uniref:RanBP2-type domain-containing protein n=1 Tax=Vitis vinifera TaxID=29760 RepID=A0A438HJ66_VITVI|nr:hypothetical protein CK203_041263 [Vitis vinifera]
MPASRNEGDWTCPKCGNMNFGFRTVCNRGNVVLLDLQLLRTALSSRFKENVQ